MLERFIVLVDNQGDVDTVIKDDQLGYWFDTYKEAYEFSEEMSKRHPFEYCVAKVI